MCIFSYECPFNSYIWCYFFTGSRLWCWSYRFTIAIMCCLSLVNMHAQQSAFITSSTCDTNISISGQYSANYYDVVCDMISNSTKVHQAFILNGELSSKNHFKYLLCRVDNVIVRFKLSSKHLR